MQILIQPLLSVHVYFTSNFDLQIFVSICIYLQFMPLQKHYSEVMAKFVKFQRPADFDGKLAHVKHLLEDIEERLSCLEIASSEPDDIQNQLDQCMVRATFHLLTVSTHCCHLQASIT